MTDDKLKDLISSALDSKLSSLFSLLSPKQSSFSLYSWLDFWYVTFKARHVPPLVDSSLYQIRNCIDKHLKGNLADVNLADLNVLDLQHCFSSISSSRMALYAYDTLNDALNRAVLFDVLNSNPLLKVDRPRHKREKKLPLTYDQERVFLQYITGTRLEGLFKFYLYSGVRKTEALTLRWSDIDTVNSRIFIAGTKTESSRRCIPLFDRLASLLSSLPRSSEFVFPYAGYTVKNAWRWLTNKHDDINYSIHSLRHTFATRCYEVGIPDKIIQRWLGHSKVSTTMNIYVDVPDRLERAAVRKFNESDYIKKPPLSDGFGSPCKI